jgi:hypothetical protein
MYEYVEVNIFFFDHDCIWPDSKKSMNTKFNHTHSLLFECVQLNM